MELLSNEIVASTLIVVVGFLLKLLISWLVVKWPSLKKLELQNKLQFVMATVDEWRKRKELETGTAPTKEDIDEKLKAVTDTIKDARVNPDNVKILRRAVKNNAIGINAGISKDSGAFIGLDFTKSF